MEQIVTAATDLERALRDRRCANGEYIAPEPAPGDKPDTYAPLAAALARALAEPPDPEHAREAARHLIDCFPNCRVGKAAYASGLADIVTDENIPPCVVRHACRRVRAEAKSLQTLADLRDRMLAELRARQALLVGLEAFPRRLAEAHKRDAEEAARVATAAARRGVTLEPGDLVAAWHGIAEGWLYQRTTLAAMRLSEDVCFEDADCLIAALETGRPLEAFQAAAELVPDLADYERRRNEALASAPAPGTPEGAVWDRQWPAPEAKFADRLAPIVAAFKRAHAL